MVRLVFRPYTQVRKAICTSAHLRASTRVSSGFALLRHSSPSFGSQQVRSHSNLSQKITVGRWCTPRGGSHLSGYFRLRGFATHRLAYMLDSLVRVSRRVGWKAQSASVSSAQVHDSPPRVAHASFLGRRDGIGGPTRARSCPAAPAHADQRPASSGGPALAVPHPTGAHPRPPFASLPAISSTF